MPQIAKGGKYVYGWSKAGDRGRIVVPDEAIEEYNLRADENAILMSGSKRSGGFSLTTVEILKSSSLAVILDKSPQLAEFQVPEGKVMEFGGRTYCWVKIHNDGSIVVPVETLKRYGVKPGDYLLSVRGSYVGVGFAVRGPIVEEAKKHSEIPLFE